MGAIRPNVFLLGASGTGKTTLMNYIGPKHQLQIVPSETRKIAESYGGWAELNTDMQKRNDFQRDVWNAVVERLRTAVKANVPFVTDRAFDCLAYTSEGATKLWSMSRGDELVEVRQMMLDYPMGSDSQTLIFYLRPHREVLAQALATDGGARAFYLDWDRVCRIDGALQFLLEHLDLPYIPIHSGNMKDRVRLIDRCVQLATRK